MKTNYQSGHNAEKVAAEYLEKHGYELFELNWRTRVCEIDIVAKKQNVIFFVEVKSRRSTHQGSGLDYITPRKLKQMRFAAECWVNDHDYTGDYELAAIEISDERQITAFIDTLI